MGVNSYRMSISRSRVLPEGVGQLNEKGMDYYKRAFDKLLAAGIMPNVTLYHWDLPQVLEEKGGWVNRDVIEWFGDYPEALYDAVKLFHDLYDIKVPIYVTENGTYTIGNETVGESGMVEDNDRIRYIQGFLNSLERAIKAGYDVRGYYLWSLMDNFEWSAGSNFKFGIMQCDKDTFELKPKKSAHFYRDFIKNSK